MCKFKVGDVVRRINCNNSLLAEVGQVATVTCLMERQITPSIVVSYGEVTSEVWLVSNTELVPSKDLTYTFKVGDRGKCRDGVPYEVVAVGVTSCVNDGTVIATRNGYVYSFRSDGTVASTPRSLDLMPPTKTVWRVELTGVKNPRNSGLLDMTSVRYYDTEENARKGIARGVNNYTYVKGPFPEEREA